MATKEGIKVDKGRKWSLDSLSSYDGTAIRYGYYHGSQQNQHTLILVNGRSEWIEKYHELYSQLGLKENCDILTWDHRGQGSSGGYRAHVNSYEEFAKDGLEVIRQTIGTEASYTILAHSMGGLITIYASLRGYFSPEQIILGSPLFMLPNTPMKRSIYIPIANLACHFNLGPYTLGIGGHLEPFSENTLTRSFRGYKKVAEGPYPSKSPSFGWISATKLAIDYIHSEENLVKLPCPTLVLGGSQEAVVDHKGFSTWVCKAHKASGQAVKFLNINGARHEIFNELPLTIQLARAQILAWHKEIKVKSQAFQNFPCMTLNYERSPNA